MCFSFLLFWFFSQTPRINEYKMAKGCSPTWPTPKSGRLFFSCIAKCLAQWVAHGPSLRADLSALFSGTSQRSHQNVLQFSLDHHIYWTSTSFVASRQFLQFLHSTPTDQTTRTYQAWFWPSLYSAGCGQMNKTKPAMCRAFSFRW